MTGGRSYLDEFSELPQMKTNAILSRVVLRSMYLVMGEQDFLGDEKVLQAMRLALAFHSGINSPDSEFFWETDIDEEGWFFTTSSSAAMLSSYLYPSHHVHELEWEQPNGQLGPSVSIDGSNDNPALDVDGGNLRLDIDKSQSVDSINQLFEEPLWRDISPAHVSNACNEFFSFMNRAPQTWSFWREWYQGFLIGKPLDWELQRRVALIPDDDWEKGPEHIAQKIEEIRTRFKLEKRLEELGAEKHLWQERARLGIGGNNPPEAIEDARMVQEIIWAPIEELKAETQSETPDNSRIKSAISKLGAALIAIGKWPLGKLDKAADEFAKSLGKWGGGACAGWLALNSDKIAEIIKAAQDWLGTLF